MRTFGHWNDRISYHGISEWINEDRVQIAEIGELRFCSQWAFKHAPFPFALAGLSFSEVLELDSHRQLSPLRGRSSRFGALSQWGLDPIKLAYNPA